MALHWPSFLARAGSAVVFAAVMLVGLLWNEWAFLVLVGLIQVFCLRDYFRLIERVHSDKSFAGFTTIIAALLLVVVALEYLASHAFPLAGGPGSKAWDTNYLPVSIVNYNPSLWPLILCAPA